MNKYIKFLKLLNFKTLYFNFKYFPFKQAVNMPVFISNKVHLRQVSGKIIFECSIRPGLVQIGFPKVGIFDYKNSRSIWEVYGTVIFRGSANIGQGSKISVVSNATLIFGDQFTITAETSIVVARKVQFGNSCLLSWDILIMDTDYHKIKDGNGKIINHPKPVTFGDKVWVGCRSLILKGAVIPNNCIIGANSTVSKALENENCLYAGSPAKCLKEHVTWEL